ncbi:cyclic nucleotide-binding/CBS domain-containing protein [candidate division KSB1 bacterium]|nr:cyclic nucleotide-binding/CBS domain-containing protein [candidate division KSB1 bacterium]
MLKANAKNLLMNVAPFNFLTPDQINRLSDHITLREEPTDKLLFTQGISEVHNLLIIENGAMEVYFESDSSKELHDVLGEGDTFGGISILCNNGFAIRTVRTIEETTLLLLPKEELIKIANENQDFSDFYTQAFGRRMLDKSYWAVVSRQYAPGKDDTLSVYNQLVEAICEKNYARCYIHDSIQGAAEKMNERKRSSIFICDPNDTVIGIVTDRDFREKVVARGLNVKRGVTEIMSSPLYTISRRSLIFEAILLMIEKHVKHLAIVDDAQRIIGVTNNERLLLSQGHSPVSLIREIQKASTIEEISSSQKRLPYIVRDLLDNGARTENINRLITSVSDNVLEKIIEAALKELPPPPVHFSFVILGSEGRREQTLKTDQDNAIIFEDVPKEKLKSVQAYFLELGRKVCGWLDKCGYQYCSGDIMAQNPKWCQPLSVWKKYFRTWILTPAPKAVMHSTIFFDFRCAAGNINLSLDLKNDLKNLLKEREANLFLYHLAQNCLKMRPPIGFFRNFVVESKGEHQNAFDIKKATTPIVDFARIYALENEVEETNTIERLKKLHARHVITQGQLEEITQAYDFLMNTRLSHHANAIIAESRKADNFINPKKLNKIEQKLLKEIFSLIGELQQKLSVHFTGAA